MNTNSYYTKYVPSSRKIAVMKQRLWRNVPMLLTWSRIAMIPFIVAIAFLPEQEMSAHTKNVWQCVVFGVAAVTDYFDGHLARRFGLVTRLGAFLDPVADKLMVCSTMILLVNQHRISVLVALIIIGREIAMTALREWMSQLGQRDAVSVHWLGKIKTNAQMIAIGLLLWHDPLFNVDVAFIGQAFASVAAVLTLWSAAHYLRLAAPHLRKK